MLKIKDNVDLKELEKFGFEPRYDEKTGLLIKYSKYDNQNNEIVKIGYVSSNHNYPMPYYQISWFCESDTLYDLIKADLVEKVD